MGDTVVRARSPMGSRLSAALATGQFVLPSCQMCSAVNYPPSEVCRVCLSDEIGLAACDPSASVIASALVVRSYADDFKDRAPTPIASVKMNVGPIVFAHAAELLDVGVDVTLIAMKDRLGDGVLGVVRNADDRDLLIARFEEVI